MCPLKGHEAGSTYKSSHTYIVQSICRGVEQSVGENEGAKKTTTKKPLTKSTVKFPAPARREKLQKDTKSEKQR